MLRTLLLKIDAFNQIKLDISLFCWIFLFFFAVLFTSNKIVIIKLKVSEIASHMQKTDKLVLHIKTHLFQV